MEHQPAAQRIVLVCPLDWGLGHATRCIPVLRAFQGAGFRVIVAAGGRALEFMKSYFGAAIEFCYLPGKPIAYPAGGGFFFKMLWQLPGLVLSVWKEHRLLQDLIHETGASIVVSDNRFGLFSKKAATVFITHQLFVRAPGGMKWLEPLMLAVNLRFIRRFDTCWVPDNAGPDNLSGALSHKRLLPGIRFVGPLSRFTELKQEEERSPLPDDFPESFVLVLLSGPEPQRSIFEKILAEQVPQSKKALVFVRGVAGSEVVMRPGEAWFNQLPVQQLAFVIRKSAVVVSRPGYSTIMDLSVFGKRALMVPTPGQTEQEYLGAMMKERGWVHMARQQDVNLKRDLPLAAGRRGIPNFLGQKLHAPDILMDEVVRLSMKIHRS